MQKKYRKGFTLIELLVVIAIIGILSTLAVVSLGNARTRARDSKRLADVRSLQSALEIYYTDQQKYPCGAGTPCAGMTDTNIEDWYLCNDATGLSVNACGAGVQQLIRVPRDPSSNSGNTESDFDYLYTSANGSTYGVKFNQEATSASGLVNSTSGDELNCAAGGGIAATGAGSCPP